MRGDVCKRQIALVKYGTASGLRPCDQSHFGLVVQKCREALAEGQTFNPSLRPSTIRREGGSMVIAPRSGQESARKGGNLSLISSLECLDASSKGVYITADLLGIVIEISKEPLTAIFRTLHANQRAIGMGHRVCARVEIRIVVTDNARRSLHE